MVRIQVIRALLSKGNLGVKFCWSVTLHGKSLVCQALNLSGGQDLDDRFIRGFPEDQVDEHHGLEDSAQAAEAPVALVVRTSVRSYCARITELLATALSTRACSIDHGSGELRSLDRGRLSLRGWCRLFTTCWCAGGPPAQQWPSIKGNIPACVGV